MDDIGLFLDKQVVPTDKDLSEKLGTTYRLWIHVRNFVFERYPKGVAEWNYPSKKSGWSYRIKDSKRAILYFLPRDGYFKLAFAFGQKAVDLIMESNLSADIKNELNTAPKYAEGRGIRIDIRNRSDFRDVERLIEIKLAPINGKISKYKMNVSYGNK